MFRSTIKISKRCTRFSLAPSATSSPLLCASRLSKVSTNVFASTNGVRFYAYHGIKERERALEEKAAREHDKMLLAELRKSLENAKKFSVDVVGEPNSFDYRVFITKNGKRVSAWHDIPLHHSEKTFNFLNEMPKGTNAKMEITLDEDHNPIKQDVKNGELRVIKYGKTGFNYGMLPQTWENPDVKLEGSDIGGDNDPLDVVELSEDVLPLGAVVPVRVVGALGLIDEGELDWKLIAISNDHPAASKINDIKDVETHFPGAVGKIREWYQKYKTADGKDENSYAFDGEPVGQAEALKIIDECHAEWAQHKKKN